MRGRLGKVQTVIRRYRRVSQLLVLALLIGAPFLQIFRFDLATTSLYLFGMRLWVKHAFVFFLLTMLVIYVIIAASLLFGRVFCGWVCPQNLFNEVTGGWDRRFGRAGSVAISALISLFGGFVVYSYFSDGTQLLRQVAAGHLPMPAAVTIGLFGAFFTMAMAWWRTGVCVVACPYGHLQSIIASHQTMHLAVINLPAHRDICATCGLCAEICHMAVDPRLPEQKDCVTCGDCLDACALVSDARRVPRVLNFVIGEGEGEVALGNRGRLLTTLRQLAPRLVIPLVMTAALAAASWYMLATRTLVDLVVVKDHRQVLRAGGAVSGGAVMAVSVMNLGQVSEQFAVQVEGLPPEWVALERSVVMLAPGESARVTLRVNPTERITGLYRFEVRVVGERSGATASFRTVHMVN